MSPIFLGPSVLPEPGANIESLLAWTFDQSLAAATGNVPAAGTINLTRIYIPQPVLVTNILCRVETIGNTLTSGQCLAGLYSTAASPVLLAQTADQSAAWVASTGTKTMAVSGGPVLISGDANGFIWGALLSNGTTSPSFQKSPSNDPNGGQTTPGANLRACRTTGTQTVLTNPIVSAAALISTFHYWMGLS